MKVNYALRIKYGLALLYLLLAYMIDDNTLV